MTANEQSLYNALKAIVDNAEAAECSTEEGPSFLMIKNANDALDAYEHLVNCEKALERDLMICEVAALIEERINGCTENNAAGAAELVVDCVISPALRGEPFGEPKGKTDD